MTRTTPVFQIHAMDSSRCRWFRLHVGAVPVMKLVRLPLLMIIAWRKTMTAAAALANGLRSEGVVIPLVDLESMFPVDARNKSWLPARLRSFIAATTIDGATSATCKCMEEWIRASEPQELVVVPVRRTKEANWKPGRKARQRSHHPNKRVSATQYGGTCIGCHRHDFRSFRERNAARKFLYRSLRSKGHAS